MSTLIRTDHLPAAERFAFWREAAGRALGRLEYHTGDESGFWGKLHCSELGAVRVRRLDMSDFTARRTPALIRPSDQDLLTLIMLLRGCGGITQGQRQVNLAPAEFAVVETTRPYEVRTVGGGGLHQALLLTFHRALLPLPPGQVRRLAAVRMGTGRGVGTLTSRFLTQLAGDFDHCHPAEAARLATAALEVLAVRLAHELDDAGQVAPETHRRALLTRIHAFIQEHLGDAELSPDMVAAAHHLSLRYLQKLFQQEGQTVAGWIRARRLEGCRRDLAGQAQAACPVAAIGARWGFPHPGHFSRAFKAAYGLTPLEYRQRARRAGQDRTRNAKDWALSGNDS